MNITITMHCSTVTVAVANHRPCHANKENLDRLREGDKVQQRMHGKRGLGVTRGEGGVGKKSCWNQVGEKHIKSRCKLSKKRTEDDILTSSTNAAHSQCVHTHTHTASYKMDWGRYSKQGWEQRTKMWHLRVCVVGVFSFVRGGVIIWF